MEISFQQAKEDWGIQPPEMQELQLIHPKKKPKNT
jgi:hypothetical protein